MSKAIPRIWNGETVWIIGGGYSLIEQFNIPHQVYQQIAVGKASVHVLNPYLVDTFFDRKVIGVNLAGFIGPWVDVLYFRDCDFYDNYSSLIRDQFQDGLRFTSCNKPNLGKGIWVLDAPSDKRWDGITTEPNQVRWNYESGGAAINLAVQFGARRIILVGYDMKSGPSGEQRWHGSHVSINKKQITQPFDRFLKSYGRIAKDAEELGVEIVNANPWSALDQFPKADVEDLL